MTKKQRAVKVIEKLKNVYGTPRTALKYNTPFQMLVATILSAQCTDERVNKVTATLFENYKTAEDFNKLPLDELEKMTSSINLYRNKAKNIKACAKAISEDYKSIIPNLLSTLITLPGIGRKTANVILGEIFNITEGIVVDTHVKRVSHRIGLTKEKDPGKIEKDLIKITDKSDWFNLSHLLISLGRKICIARKPKCYECPVVDLCLYKNKNLGTK